ncbi:MAG TPA: hypothetical protein VMB72_11830 [Acidimicrobiales bacterium]|nr:hypothetical protein [Acidimicrobiales bacterium]
MAMSAPREYVSSACRVGEHQDCLPTVRCACACHHPALEDRAAR